MTEARSSRRTAERSLLRNPLSVVAAAMASFLVVLVLMTARVVSGHDPALLASGPNTALVSRVGNTVLRTTASGRVIGPATAGAGTETSGAQPATLITRTSGGAGAGAQDE
jgi:hypothetical protein